MSLGNSWNDIARQSTTGKLRATSDEFRLLPSLETREQTSFPPHRCSSEIGVLRRPFDLVCPHRMTAPRDLLCFGKSGIFWMTDWSDDFFYAKDVPLYVSFKHSVTSCSEIL